MLSNVSKWKWKFFFLEEIAWRIAYFGSKYLYNLTLQATLIWVMRDATWLYTSIYYATSFFEQCQDMVILVLIAFL